MTDINIWTVPLSPELVARWSACQEEERLQEDKIVDWNTANWSLERVDVKTIQKTEVCWETAKDDIYPFPSFEKNFLDSVDFCNILKGTIPVPRTESVMSDINKACEGAPYTGYNDLEEEGRFVDPYTNQAMDSSYWAPHEPNNWGVGEDCTEVREDLKLNDKGVFCVEPGSGHQAGTEIFF